MRKLLQLFQKTFLMVCLSMGLWMMNLSANNVDMQTIMAGSEDKVADDCFPPFFYFSEMDTSFFMMWQDDPTATYLLYYCPTGLIDSTVCLAVTGTSYEFVGLPSNTSFSFWMAKICNGDTSDISAVQNYVTPCGTYTAPYTETVFMFLFWRSRQ